MRHFKLIIPITLILLSLTSCNGGRDFFLADKNLVIKNKNLDLIKDEEINVKKLYGKGDFSGATFLGKEFSSYDEAREILIKKAQNANIYKNRCAIMVSYFLPLYPWDIWFSPEKARKNALVKALKKANKSGKRGHLVKDIIFKEVWFGGPIFSYSCIAAAATLSD